MAGKFNHPAKRKRVRHNRDVTKVRPGRFRAFAQPTANLVPFARTAEEKRRHPRKPPAAATPDPKERKTAAHAQVAGEKRKPKLEGEEESLFENSVQANDQ
jgi:hypothetical protein